MIFTPRRRPASSSAWMTTRCSGTVVVRSEDRPTIVGSISRTASTIVSVGTSLPRSCTWKPAVFIIAPTMFLPRSWRSPFTVAMRTLCPSVCPPAAMSAGSTTALHCLKISAAATTSGRNTSPAFHRRPISSIASARPCCSTCCGSTPASINSAVSATARGPSSAYSPSRRAAILSSISRLLPSAVRGSRSRRGWHPPRHPAAGSAPSPPRAPPRAIPRLRPPGRLPVLPGVQPEEPRLPLLAHVAERVWLCQVVPARSDLVDDLDGEILVRVGHAPAHRAHEGEDLGVEQELDDRIHARTVQEPSAAEHVGPPEPGREDRQPVLQASLPVRRLRGGRERADVGRHAVPPRELGARHLE